MECTVENNLSASTSKYTYKKNYACGTNVSERNEKAKYPQDKKRELHK